MLIPGVSFFAMFSGWTTWIAWKCVTNPWRTHPSIVAADPKLVHDWIALQYLTTDAREYERFLWAFDVAWELTEGSPDAAWEFILTVLKTDSSPKILENLAAGPLECLLANHGSTVIERVEQEAKGNSEFASLLGGVWRNTISDEIWARVQSVWDRRGWDGV
jgi:hypothetical protein